MTCFIGVDLHKTQFTVHTRTENRVESMDQIIQYPVTNEGYANFLKRIRNLKTRGYEVKIGVESTGNTRYFKSQVEKAGAEVTVINTLKFKVINESTKKTDKHDASTISEFLSKDMLPESYLCNKETENLRRLLKSRERLVRSIVGQKNEIHALLVSMGLPDELRCLQTNQNHRLSRWFALRVQPFVTGQRYSALKRLPFAPLFLAAAKAAYFSFYLLPDYFLLASFCRLTRKRVK